MRVAYFTYWGNIGKRVLEWMVNNTDAEIVAVVSRPGPPGETIKEIAFKYYLPLYQPMVNVNDPKFIAVLRKLEPDLFISMYFGRLFSPEMLAVPKIGCINMHPSLLPKYRGQGPSTWPIINGDTETGQTVHWLDEGIDTGDIIAQKRVPITPEDTGATLSAKLEECGYELFIETWPLLASGNPPRIPQDDSQASYSVAPRTEHARIRWRQPAQRIHNQVRAFTRPGRGAWCRIGGQKLLVWKTSVVSEPLPVADPRPGRIVAVLGEGIVVQTGDGQLLLREVQVGPEGPDLLPYLGRIPEELPVVLG